MKIQAGEKLYTFDGKPFKVGAGEQAEDITVGQVLAEILAADGSGGKMKMYSLAKKLFDGKETVEVDKADLIMIKSCVEKTKMYSVVICGQLMEKLEDIKE